MSLPRTNCWYCETNKTLLCCLCSSEAEEMPRKVVEKKLICNKAQCRNCGDIIISTHKHHFITCSCWLNSKELEKQFPESKKYRKTYSKTTGNWTLPYYKFIKSLHGIAIDGGIDYVRRLAYDMNDIIDLCEYEEINVTKVKKKVRLRGNRFSIKRERDNFGTSGYLFCLTTEGALVGKLGEIRVGCLMRCGGLGVSTYNDCSIITSTVSEILQVNKQKSEATIKTRNSIYHIKRID